MRPARTGLSPLARIAISLIALTALSPLGAPIDVPEWFGRARAALATQPQDLETADAALRRAALRLPYDGLTRYRTGQVALANGDADIALTHFEAAFVVLDVGAAQYLALGDAYLAQGRRAEAVTAFETARAEAPGDPAVLERLAAAYEADGQYAEAMSALDELATSGTATAAQRYRLALLTSVNEPNAAGARLAVVAELPSPDQGNARHMLDTVTAALTQDDPALTSASIGIGLIQINEWALAEAALQQAVTLNDAFADAFAYLALAQDRQGKDGEPALAQAAALAPDSVLVNYLYGLHFRDRGESAKAIPWLHKAQAADPNNPAIAAELGGAYAATGDLTNGELWFRKAVSLDERDGQFWLLLARFYVEREFKVAEEGLPAARMAVGLGPQNALAADALGYALFLTGDTVTGRQEIERALGLDPGLAAAHYHLGVILLSQDEREAARPYLDQALALDPQGPYGDLALKALALTSP